MTYQSSGVVSPRPRTTVIRGKPGNPCTIQDLYLQECLLGVKLAERNATIGDFRARLVEQLPQGSPETRERYATRIAT